MSGAVVVAVLETSWLWPALFAAPIVWLVAARGAGRRAAAVRAITGTRSDLGSLAQRIGPGSAWRRAAFAAGVLAAGVAALTPSWGSRSATASPAAADIVVCLDVSRSMLAGDAAPSRLAVARAALRRLAGDAAGDRLALVAFAGEARLVVPLTHDVLSFSAMADECDVHTVERGGTDLGAAITVAMSSFDGVARAGRAVIVLTDGEDHGGTGARAAASALAAGVVVHCAAVGTSRGGKIAAEGGARAEFLRDGAGREVVSAMDPVSLRRVATAGGGAFLDVTEGAPALHAELVAPLPRSGPGGDGSQQGAPRFQWFAGLALVLWVVSAWPGRPSEERR